MCWPTKTEYVRRCKICNNFYKTKMKYSEICKDCDKSNVWRNLK